MLEVVGAVAAHGAATHTDIFRFLYIPTEAMALDSGTRGNLGTAPDNTEIITLADAATQGVVFGFAIPGDWVAASAVTLQNIYWAPSATDGTAHTVRWSVDAKHVPSLTDITAAGTTNAFTGPSSAKTANQLQIEAPGQGLGTPAAAGDYLRINLRRLGSDGADTYVGNVQLVGVRIQYTANQ